MKKHELAPFLEECGLRAIEVRRSKHWKVLVERSDGSRTTVSIPTTPGDWRALRNKRSQLTNIAKGVNMNIKTISAKELFSRGYVGLSSKHRIVARIDRANWLEHMAGRYFRSVADFYVRKGPLNTPTESTGGWGKHYCAVFSEDKVEGIPEAVYKELKALWNSSGEDVKYVEPRTRFQAHRELRRSETFNCRCRVEPITGKELSEMKRIRQLALRIMELEGIVTQLSSDVWEVRDESRYFSRLLQILGESK